jgi:hypothetical protein
MLFGIRGPAVPDELHECLSFRASMLLRELSVTNDTYLSVEDHDDDLLLILQEVNDTVEMAGFLPIFVSNAFTVH